MAEANRRRRARNQTRQAAFMEEHAQAAREIHRLFQSTTPRDVESFRDLVKLAQKYNRSAHNGWPPSREDLLTATTILARRRFLEKEKAQRKQK